MQEHCAMKVTTDACIQGAWTPTAADTKRILDIGTGTGLLALMLAQKQPGAIIDAVELDKDAALQATENAAASLWAGRINIIEGDITTYTPKHKYSLIISNPPFFINSLLGVNANKNAARHTLSLGYQDLFAAIDRNLAENGIASILLPEPESQIWEALIERNGWHIASVLSVKHRENAVVKRKVMCISRNATGTTDHETLIIQNEDGSYTKDFTKLLAPYYLQL